MFKLVQKTVSAFPIVSEAIVDLVTSHIFRKNLNTTNFQKIVFPPRPPSPETIFSNTFANFVS